MLKNKTTSYYAVATDKWNRWNCSGGGVLQLLAEHIIKKGGKICIPVFAQDFRSVIHIVTDSMKDIRRILEIQYIQSNIGDILNDIKKYLDEDITVLFVGVPCDVNKLKNSLAKDYKKLYTVSLGCKGLASSDIWQSWLKSINSGIITSAKFGAKELDCDESIIIQFNHDREKIHRETKNGSWFTAYNIGLLTSDDCNKCKFTDSDLLLCVLPDTDKNFNDGKGATFLSINSQKGKNLYNEISSEITFSKEMSEEKALELKAIGNPLPKNDEAKLFSKIYSIYGYKSAMEMVQKNVTTSSINYIINYHAGDSKPWSAIDNRVWNIPFLHDGYIVLQKCSDNWQRIFLPLDQELVKGKIYCYDIKFRAMTTVKDIYFQITTKATNDNTFTEAFGRTPSTEQWTRIQGKFTCIFDGHKYFDISSAILTGNEKMMYIDWIRIWEE